MSSLVRHVVSDPGEHVSEPASLADTGSPPIDELHDPWDAAPKGAISTAPAIVPPLESDEDTSEEEGEEAAAAAALARYVKAGDPHAVGDLLAEGADPNARDARNAWPLLLSADSAGTWVCSTSW